LDQSSQEEIQTAWMEEIGRRIRFLEKGEVKAIPEKEVMQAIRDELLKQ
jgi:hypothetical protein